MERDGRATGHPDGRDVLRDLMGQCQFGPFLVYQLRNLIGEVRVEIPMDHQQDSLADRWDVGRHSGVELFKDRHLEEEVAEFLLQRRQDGVERNEVDPNAWPRRRGGGGTPCRSGSGGTAPGWRMATRFPRRSEIVLMPVPSNVTSW